MQFTHKLKVSNGSSINFTFSKGYTVYGGRYLVEASENEKPLFSFKMKRDNDQWIIIGSSAIPEWLWQLESTLSDIINQHK